MPEGFGLVVLIWPLNTKMSADIPGGVGKSEKDRANNEEQLIGEDSFGTVPEVIDQEQEILAVLDLDPALNKKMHIVNNVSGQFS